MDNNEMPEWAQTLLELIKASTGLNIEAQPAIKDQIAAKLTDVPASAYKDIPLPTSPNQIDAFCAMARAKHDAQIDAIIDAAFPWSDSKKEKEAKAETRTAEEKEIDDLLSQIM